MKHNNIALNLNTCIYVLQPMKAPPPEPHLQTSNSVLHKVIVYKILTSISHLVPLPIFILLFSPLLGIFRVLCMKQVT